jgi:predicted AlkP superfamily pyrophosphatase or phosphodiesterase
VSKAILIVIDGCRSDGLQKAHTPVLDGLVANGAHTLQAQTVQPSLTLPAHFSIFSSLRPYNHGVLTNAAVPAYTAGMRTIVDHARDRGKTTAAFFSWDQLKNIFAGGSLDCMCCWRTTDLDDSDLRIAQWAMDYTLPNQPDFCFIYLERTDYVGHATGFMSVDYLKAIEMADQAVGLILENLRGIGSGDTYNVLIQSDHGGVGDHHLKDCPEVSTVPWIAAGPAIRQGLSIDMPLSVLDSAPTLAAFMGIPAHPSWQGRVPNIFKDITGIPEMEKPRTPAAA